MLDSVSFEKGQSKIHQLKALLYLLQEHLDRYNKDIASSYLNFPESKEEVSKIEKLVKNPQECILESILNIDQHLKDLVSKLVENFFKRKSQLLWSVHLTKNANNSLYYAIVLKDDTMDNRTSIFEFFEWYNKHKLDTFYPVYFQFVPLKLIDKINKISELNLK